MTRLLRNDTILTSLRWFIDEAFARLPVVLAVACGLGVAASLIWGYGSMDTRMARSRAEATATARQFLQRLGTPAQGEIICTSEEVWPHWSCAAGVNGRPLPLLCSQRTTCILAPLE